VTASKEILNGRMPVSENRLMPEAQTHRHRHHPRGALGTERVCHERPSVQGAPTNVRGVLCLPQLTQIVDPSQLEFFCRAGPTTVMRISRLFVVTKSTVLAS
jgi:hypothetical protein